MKEEEVIRSIQTGTLQCKRDWFNDIMGLCPFLFFWFASAVLLFAPHSDMNPLKFLFFYISGVVFCYGIYSLVHENNLMLFETGLDATSSHLIIVKAFQELNWEVDQNAANIVTAHIYNPYGFVDQYITALIVDGSIYLNVKQKGTFKGRIPFFFGYNQKRIDQIGDQIMENLRLLEQGKSINSFA